MNGEEKHLDIEQIERLIGIEPDGPGPGESASLEEAQRHLAACEDCQKLVSMAKEGDRLLRGLRETFPAEASAGCPPEASLYELAVGSAGQEDAVTLIEHVAGCDRCGPILRQAQVDLGSKLTSHEEETLASLATSQPKWQEAFAGSLAATTRYGSPKVSAPVPNATVEPRRTLLNSGWLYAFAAILVICAIVAGGIVWRSRPAYAQSLLADAYAQRRVLEIRMPGAKYGPMRVTRGGEISNFNKPESLLEAEALIAKHLNGREVNLPWLQAKERADLLDGNYQSAIRTTERALELEPDSPSLLGDLGSAYFQQAEREQRAIDYGRAYESLSKSLAKKPNDPVVLFNRAIVSERAQLYTQAEEDWKQYLRIETDSAWQKEGRERFEQLERRLREHNERNEKPLSSPDEVAATLSGGQEEQIADIDSSADAYGEIALEQWIPQLTSDRIVDSTRRHSLETALSLLAQRLRVRHHDLWFSDFLSVGSFSRVSLATQILLRAIQANAAGQHETAMQIAGDAEIAFERESNEPGRMRAAFEKIYSARLAGHGNQCHEGAEALVDQVRGRNYRWIEIQSRLELAACAAEVSRIDESIDKSQEALELAKSAKYGNLELRAITFTADLLGDPSNRFNLLANGLLTYWGGRYEPMRGYSLYAVMDTSADDLHLWFLDEAVIKQGLGLIPNDPHLSLRGLEWYRLARAELAVGELEQAERSFSEARTLLKSSPSQDLITGTSIELAEAYMVKGRYRDALDLLDSVDPLLSKFSNEVVLGRFHSVRAAALLGDGQRAEAERELVPALLLANKGLDSISNERDRFEWIQTFAPVYQSLAHLNFQSDTAASFRWWESLKGASVRNEVTPDKGLSSIESSPPKLPQFEAWRTEGTLLVSYATFRDGIAIWTYDGTQVRGKWLQAPLADVDLLAHRFAEGCGDRTTDRDTLLRQGRELYELLVKPADEWIRGRRRLIFETDNMLGSVPFEALVDERGKYLADSYEIEYSAGLLYLAASERHEPVNRTSRVLVVGESGADTTSGLPPLPDALDEAREVAAHFSESHLLLEGDAKLATVLKELPDAEVFHFVGHAITNHQASGLLLADSQADHGARFLDVRRFDSQLLAQSRLIVLSSCSSATGFGLTLNDRDSFARNALAAGVPNVVASRWPVDSMATREWMRVFYGSLLAGESVSLAASHARSSLSGGDRWRHPFYWAAFGVFV